MRRISLVDVGVPCLLAAGISGCDQANTFQAPPPPAVTVQSPSVRTVTIYDAFTGRLESENTVEIRARVRGFLLTQDFRMGHIVEAGQLLFTIEPDQYEAALETAEAELARQEANLSLQEATLQRVQQAFDRDAATELEVLEQIAIRDNAAALVRSAEASIRDAQLNLDYTRITSPIEGRMSRERVDVGNLVGATDATLLATVVDDHPMKVYFNVSERDIVRLLVRQGGRRSDRGGPGLPFRLTLADGSEYEVEGEIIAADNTVNATTGTVEVQGQIDNPSGILAPGMFVRVRVPQPESEQMLVPEVALQRDLLGDYALIVNAENVVERRDVRLGARVGPDRVVLEGLEPTDRVIVRGLQRARPDRPVTPSAAEQAADSESAAQ